MGVNQGNEMLIIVFNYIFYDMNAIIFIWHEEVRFFVIVSDKHLFVSVLALGFRVIKKLFPKEKASSVYICELMRLGLVPVETMPAVVIGIYIIQWWLFQLQVL